jgi:hypothetical protein
MAQCDFTDLSIDQLQSYYSDFHKDFYGWRPRGATPEQWTDREFLVDRINAIHTAMDVMKASPAGREQLRADGWVVDEPEVIDPQEYADWSADLDAQYYGEMA